MISIVTSSYNHDNFKYFEKNICETIGASYELICINNPGLMGICEAYNKGALQAKYDVVCFVHEDVKFHTKNWGNTLSKILKDESIGVVGVAGGTYKSRILSSAWYNGKSHINLIQHTNGECFHWQEPKEYRQELADVLIVDGVFMALRKKVWETYKFDEQTLKGFHFYDMDICLTVKSKGLRVCVSYDILLEHFSSGSNNKDWYKEAKLIHKKWRNSLPWSLYEIDRNKAVNFEYAAAAYKLKLALKEPGFNLTDKAQAVVDLIAVMPFKLNTYRIIKQNLFN